jgi:ABC-type Fe3+-hydroxamate transport system substrate-binding protein
MSRRSEREEIEILENIEAIAVGQSIILESINANLARLVAALAPFATTAQLDLGGTMSDLTLTFVDSTGTEATPPKGDGSGLVVTGSSDGTTTVGAFALGTDPDTVVAPLTVVDDGSVSNLTAIVSNVSGAELFDDDGVTPFVQPPAFAFTAPAPPPPAQATTATLSVA